MCVYVHMCVCIRAYVCVYVHVCVVCAQWMHVHSVKWARMFTARTPVSKQTSPRTSH